MARKNPVPTAPPVPVLAPSPTGPPPAPHIFVTGGNPLGVDRGPANSVGAPLPTVPATVESTWRILATALGQSAPANSMRARRAIRAIAGTGR